MTAQELLTTPEAPECESLALTLEKELSESIDTLGKRAEPMEQANGNTK